MQTDSSRPVRTTAMLVAVFLCWFYSLTASADTTFPGDFFLFPDVKIDYISNGLQPGEDSVEYQPEIDLFYSYKKGSLLALVEYFLNKDENEFERLQIGWTDNKNTTAWLGRFHNPLGYWNMAQHHGIYLQTSISRPSIAEFADDGGIMPMHITGALFEVEAALDGGTNLVFDIALGASPTMENGELQPVDIWRYGATKSHENLTLRVRYIPDFINDTQLGLFTGYTRMEGDGVSTDEIKQTQAGAFGVWDNNTIKLLGSVFFIDTTLTLPGNAESDGNFVSGYLQAEYAIDNRFTLYGRIEDTSDVKSDPYLALFPLFVESREMVGLRYDVIRNHAFTLEVKNDQMASRDVTHIVLQWSALLP
ncbi:MAG: hypothetical protein ACC650_09160 [Gammaproteobacteria bacterium]